MKISVKQLHINIMEKLFQNTEGVKYADKGRFKEAAKCFTNAIELEPRDSLSYFNRATVKINLGDVIGARSDFALSESYKLGK